MSLLFARAYDCLLTCDPDAKCAAAAALKADWDAGHFPNLESPTSAKPIAEPGRPARPVLVSPFEVERRSAHTHEGRAALIHALTHKFAGSKFGRATGAARGRFQRARAGAARGAGGAEIATPAVI